eukprot:188195-Chlamydomonas_euryale.AAC.1
MGDAAAVLERSGFMFQRPGGARVIGGVEEGAYGWVAMNYVQGGLHSAVLGAPLEVSSAAPAVVAAVAAAPGDAAGHGVSGGGGGGGDGDGTAGSLDLGGSSLEVRSLPVVTLRRTFRRMQSMLAVWLASTLRMLFCLLCVCVCCFGNAGAGPCSAAGAPVVEAGSGGPG